jgi:uncharacterized protein involved in type VI secretion and phage assembly
VERELPVAQIPDRPDFAIEVDGTALDREQHDHVVRVDVHEEVGKLARASLLVRNWDDDRNQVRFSGGAPFALGKPVNVRLGYGSELEPVFDGLITGLRGVFRSNRDPHLEVSCRCRGVLLSGARRSRILADATDADLATAIAGDHGLSAEAADGAHQPVVVQDDMTDWDMLRERAQALGYALYVRETTLVLGPPSVSPEPVATLQWGGNLVEVDLDEDVASLAEQVTAAGWDPATLDAGTAQAGAGDSAMPHGDRPDVATVLADAGLTGREDRAASPAALTPDELDRRARGTVDRDALQHTSGTGRTLGLPRVRIDTLLALSGCGGRFDGPHYVSAVRHTLDATGYSTEFQLGQPRPLSPGGGHCRPRLSLAIGVVDDIDDPDGRGSVKVRMPWLDPDVEGVWARLAVPAAGPDRGFFFIPEVGDEVVVGFLGGDSRHPVVLGSLWNGQHSPPESLDAQTNAIREIVSRAGHKLRFDDSDGSALVLIETAASQTVTVDDTSGSEKIALADKSGNKLTLDSSGITLEAKSGGDIVLKSNAGKVVIDAMQLDGKASATAKLQSSATLDLQASAALGLTGGVVKINS